MNHTPRVRKISSDKARVISDKLRAELREKKATLNAVYSKIQSRCKEIEKYQHKSLFSTWKINIVEYEGELRHKRFEMIPVEFSIGGVVDVLTAEKDKRVKHKIAKLRNLFDFRKKQDLVELERECEKIVYGD